MLNTQRVIVAGEPQGSGDLTPLIDPVAPSGAAKRPTAFRQPAVSENQGSRVRLGRLHTAGATMFKAVDLRRGHHGHGRMDSP
jgi:hypothetical protein